MTAKAIDFIERNHENPFFVYPPYPLPHVPLLVSVRFEDNTSDGAYGNVVTELNAGIG